jgi:argininosuccinate synthase
MKKVILAFSGGLDTCYCALVLKEKGYSVVTVTVDTGGFTAAEKAAIAKKSQELGVLKHVIVDAKQDFFDNIIAYTIQSHGLYQGSYPNMCADRYIIVEQLVSQAKKENTLTVAHGCSSAGNDLVRFQMAFAALCPSLTVLTPTHEIDGNRGKEQEYLMAHGFSVPGLHKKYSVNQNILGVTYSGSEIDECKAPNDFMFLWTNGTKIKSVMLTIGFKKGTPVSVNGKHIKGATILAYLNKLAGSYGFGKSYYTGDCVVGIKGHLVFEAPGILTLIKAHHALAQLVLTKAQQEIADIVGSKLTDMVYSGKYYDPAVFDLKAFFDAQQTHVSGTATVQFSQNSVQVIEVTSPFALISPSIAMYGQHSSWTPGEVQGFIKLYGLQQAISADVQHSKGEL